MHTICKQQENDYNEEENSEQYKENKREAIAKNK